VALLGESIYLRYKLKVYSVFAPIYMTDDGYVIGFADDTTRYIPLTAEKIAALQRQRQLPTPLPLYALTWGDWLYGYLLWVCLFGVGAIAGASFVVTAARRRRNPGGGTPLTVAAMAARRNRFVLMVLALSLLPILAIVWLAHGFWLTVFHGPREATGAEIVAAQTRGDDHESFVLAEKPQYLNVSRLFTWRTRQGRIEQTQFFLYVVPGSPSILFEAESTIFRRRSTPGFRSATRSTPVMRAQEKPPEGSAIPISHHSCSPGPKHHRPLPGSVLLMSRLPLSPPFCCCCAGSSSHCAASAIRSGPTTSDTY
jgi:hypothetical protein